MKEKIKIIPDIEDKYKECYIDEEITKQSKKLTEKIKLSLDKGKNI